MDTQTQIDRLIELAIIQRSELKQLVEQLPQLREHLNAEVEKVFDETEPQLRAELEEWTTKQTADKTAALGVALESKIADLAKSLEISTQARYNAIIAEREENARLAAQAEAKIAEHAASLPGAVKEIVSAELARFPRAGEIDQLRKEFAEPKSLNPRGKWQAGETYNKLDLVTINGDSYVSNIDGNTEKPSRSAANWTLNAARGNSGGGGGVTSLTDLVPVPSNGQLLIGNGSAFVNNTLTAGTGVTITNGAGTITIDASGAQEILTATVKNAESVAITRGQVVYLFSATGGFPSVKLAYNTSDATSAKTFGVVSDVSIAPNGTGTITCVGVVSNLNLGAYNDGDTVYLGATPGSFTATKPYAPNHLVYVGIIERANAGNGELYVRIQNGYELDEIHDVQINSPLLAGQTLIYDATTDLWKNARLTAGVGVSISNGDSAITISADGGVNYQGTWNASTNTPTLTSSVGTKGFYYVVSVAGSTNLNGVTDWKVGDWAIFNGTAWEKVDTTDQVSSVFGRTGAVVGVSTDYSAVGITNTAIGASNPSTGAFTTLSASTSLTSPDVTLGTSGPSVKSSLSARAPRQGLVFDSSAHGGAPIANQPAFGTSDFTVTAWVNPVAVASNVYILSSVADSASLFFTGTTVQWIANASAVISVSGGVVANKSQLFVVTRSAGTTTYYYNGVAVSTTSSGSGNLANPIVKMGGSASGGSGHFNGTISALIYNRALSASEVVALYESGAPSGADYNSASNTSLITGDNSTFASDTGYWTKSGSVTIGGGNATFSAGGAFLRRDILTGGKRFRLTVVITANTAADGLIIYNGGSNLATYNTTGTKVLEIAASTAASPANSLYLYQAGAGGVTVDTVTLDPLGLLLAPDAAQAGGGLVWYDTSGNAANITLPASGVSWNVPTSGYVTSGSSINLSAGGTNQNITLTPSGTGKVTLSSGASAQPMLDITNTNTVPTKNGLRILGPNATSSSARQFALIANSTAYGDLELRRSTTNTGDPTSGDYIFGVSANGNFLIGTTTDVGPRLLSKAKDNTYAGAGIGIVDQSAGTSYITRANGTFYISNNGSTDHFALDASGNATFAGKVTATTALISSDYVQCDATGAYNLGNPTTDGTWRFVISGTGNLLIQRRESGAFVTKSTISA